jgi:hypothetical protein
MTYPEEREREILSDGMRKFSLFLCVWGEGGREGGGGKGQECRE